MTNGISDSGHGKFLLALLSGAMLGASFPPLHTGLFAAIGLVPLLVLLKSVDRYGVALRCSYLAFFVFNLIALYWTGGFVHAKDSYMMVAGGLLILVHPFFFFVPVACFVFFRRRFGFNAALVAFPFFWTSFEFLHSLSEIAFPWLALGNSQTYDLPAIQFASITGVLGVSLWLVILNVILFRLYEGLTSRPRRAQAVALPAALFIVLFVAPRIWGGAILPSTIGSPDAALRLAMVQPNSDPFEKWQSSGEEELATLERLTRDIPQASADLIVWPETAVPFFVLHPANARFLQAIRSEIDSLGMPLLTGIPDITYYPATSVAPKSSKLSPSGERYDTYNSSMLIEPHRMEIQKYAKIILVPFAERVPYSEQLSFLNAMQWNFGLGGWGIGRDTTVFHFTTRTGATDRFSNMICYESIYPGYVSSFVRKGAEFLTVITNDSWWGNTSGTYQHAQFGVLRAIENRRWIAQCANGGISCIIDPWGRTIESTRMFTQTVLVGRVDPRTELTFYTEHGEWLGELCSVIAAFFLATAGGKGLYFRIRKSQEANSVIDESNPPAGIEAPEI